MARARLGQGVGKGCEGRRKRSGEGKAGGRLGEGWLGQGVGRFGGGVEGRYEIGRSR